MRRSAADPVGHDKLASQLSKVEYFQGIPLNTLVEFVKSGKLLSLPADTIIMVEDAPSDGLFVLIKGRVRIFKLGANGQISIINILEPVTMFNEVTAIDHGTNPASAQCMEDCLLWRLSADELEALILKYPRVALGMLNVMVKRNRALVNKFRDLSFDTLLNRTARLLYDLSDQGTRPIDRRIHPNFQMAAQISTGPEAFSRCIKTLRQQKLIETTRNHITVTDAAGLNALWEAKSVI